MLYIKVSISSVTYSLRFDISHCLNPFDWKIGSDETFIRVK